MYAKRTLLTAALAVSPWIGPIASAGEDDIDLTEIVKMGMGTMTMGQPGEERSFPPFEEVTKGMKSDAGLFTLWSYPADAVDKDQERLLAQIPARLLGEQFMLSTSVAGGGYFTAFPLDQRVVKWEMQGKQLVLVEPQTRYITEGSKDVADAVRRTYPEQIRVAVPILTKSGSGDPVIDLGPLLKSNFADIGWMVNPMPTFGFGGPPGANINLALSKWSKRKTFELNVELGVELAVAQMNPPGSFTKLMVHYSFWSLPKTDYQPREADDRVGYFLTANQDWGRSVDSRDLFNRYIDRWHLQKRDPSLSLSEPKQPIIYYIEKTVPVRFRRAVRDGILEWNRAYEKVGIAGAIEVRQQTDDNEYRNLDPEDMRYSFFRWIVTGGGFAMGPHRSNPFTGQIYDADIVFDDSMVRFYQQDYETQLVPSALVALKFSDPASRAFLAQNPDYGRPVREWERAILGKDPKEPLIREAARQRLAKRGYCNCDYSEMMKHQLALGQAMLCDQPPEKLDQYLYDVVKEVVMHEVGHTLGLRHNFIASTVYTLQEIESRRKTGEPTTGSVMDYNPALFFTLNASVGHYLTPTIGPYDYWAIEYGYRPYEPGKSIDGAKPDAKTNPQPETKSPEPKPQAQVAPAVPGKVAAGLDDVPAEIREKLPPEILEMLKKGGAGVSPMAGGAPGAPGASAGAAMNIPTPPAGESEMLCQIAGRSAEPLLAYATDEDTFGGPDPRVNRFDCGADPIDWARTRIELVDKRLANIMDWAVKDKESWYHLRQAYQRLVFERVSAIDFAGRYIGGQYFNRAHKGDANAAPPLKLIEPDRQRAAMKFLEDTVFSDKFFATSADVLNHLVPPRWWHDGMVVDYNVDYPVHDYIAIMQWWNLVDRLSPATLRRIHDAELKSTSADRFTVAEYLQRIQKSCWADVTDTARAKGSQWTDAGPFVSDVRRSLQREYLGLVEPLVRRSPGTLLSPDLQAMLRYSLQTLAEQMGEVMKDGALDFASRAHLSACKQRIDRMLSPELREIEYSSGFMMFGQPGAQPAAPNPAR